MRVLFVALAVLVAVPLEAQDPPPVLPTQARVLVLPGTGDPLTLAPLRVLTFPIGPALYCGHDPATLGPEPSGPVVNPKLLAFDDPFTPGRACRLNFPLNLTDGSYQWAVVTIAPTCPANPVGPCISARTVGRPPGFAVVTQTVPPPGCVEGAFTYKVGASRLFRLESAGALAEVARLTKAGWRMTFVYELAGAVFYNGICRA